MNKKFKINDSATKLRRRGRAFLTALAGSTVLSCGGPILNPGGPLDVSPILDRLDNTTTNISSDATRWVATLDALVQDLTTRGFTQAASYVRDTLQNGIARVGIEYRCNVDFTAARVKAGLKAIRDAIATLGKDTTPKVEFPSFVCTATPDRIAWPEAPQAIALAGYDFNRDAIKVAVVDRNGQESDITSAMTQSSPYQLLVNLSGAGAAFPRSCTRVVVRWKGNVLSEVPCLTDCPVGPGPVIIPAESKVVLSETHICGDSALTGCRFDRFTQVACPNGFFRVEPFEVTRVAGKGTGNCGEGDQNSPSSFRTHWQSTSKSDCSIHMHIGLEGGTWGGSQTCRFVVTAVKPEQVIPRPSTPVGWCK